MQCLHYNKIIEYHFSMDECCWNNPHLFLIFHISNFKIFLDLMLNKENNEITISLKWIYWKSRISDLLSKNYLYELIVLDNFSNSSKETLDKISFYTNKKITYFEVDLRDEKKLNNILKVHKPDITIHLAGLKSVAESELNPILYYENNVSGTIQLLKSLDTLTAKKLFFLLQLLFMEIL